LLNNTDADLDLTVQRNIGFFQYARHQLFTADHGYDTATGKMDWVAYDGGPAGFVFRAPGQKLAFYLSVSGFDFLTTPGFGVDACGTKTVDWAQYVVGGPDLDGLLAAVRRTDAAGGVDPW